MFTFAADPSFLLSLVVIGMALSLGDINAVFRRARGDSRNVGTAEALRSLAKHMQVLGNPDLQFVPFDCTANADIVLADVGCKLFAIYVKKPVGSTVDAWLKISNHATVAAANADLVIFLQGTGGGGRAYCPVFHDGLKFATGLTLASHTTVNGSTDTADADAATGFVILGAA